MTRREWIVKMVRDHNLKTIAEIGCDSGWTTGYILREVGHMLDCFIAVERIVKYTLYSEFQWDEIDEWGKTRKPAVLMRMASVDAAKLIADCSLDFIFIDADHDYKSVKEDIDAWTPKVKYNGIIAGHDYDPTGGFDVWRVVDEYYGKGNFEVILDDAGGPNNHCWWLRRKGG